MKDIGRDRMDRVYHNWIGQYVTVLSVMIVLFVGRNLQERNKTKYRMWYRSVYPQNKTMKDSFKLILCGIIDQDNSNFRVMLCVRFVSKQRRKSQHM